ncbi:PDZ domain-containing protein [Brevibacillus sp. SYP-B805]|uniref:PDZ domain-containing protein n=1 Tax=Brevibacillus sp. SYP-B805 TaxID=1578199 RepID=UPI0013EBFC8B|nr:PDZ domain-containing protein [Brevibacillus sp. SYP-B805]NGQ95684.1 PDZ domain-containing protein [Brevibacillus sp. SYP-B805]
MGWNLLLNVLNSMGWFLLNPLMYVFVLFIYLHYRRQMVMERQLFAVRIHAPLLQTIRAVGMGLAGGAAASVAAGALGIAVQERDLWMLWMLAAALALFRLRFLCMAYAAGILTLLHGMALLLPAPSSQQGIGVVVGWLRDVAPVPLLGMVAILHLAEALLVRWNAGRDASPLFLEGKRGRIIGGFQLHSFWLTPLVLLVPVAPGSGWSGALFPGWPLFAPETDSFALLLLPAVTGFSDITTTMVPVHKARVIARQLAWYALVLLAVSYASVWVPPLTVVAALVAIVGHEGLFWLSQRREKNAPPAFIQSADGVKVLAVIPGTPAEEMGIKPGEVIVKVNGIPVRQKEDLYPALQANPAFCKMEVLTHDKEIKFVQCAVYAGNHHQLGIIVVPDASTQYYVDLRRLGVVQLLKQRLKRLRIGA